MKNLFCILCILFTCQRGFSTNNVLENEYYKLIFDIETDGESYDEMDETTREILTKWIKESCENEEEYERKLKKIKADILKNPLNMKGIFLYSTNPIMAFNSTSLSGQILEVIGVKNIAADLSADKPILSAEYILQQNPDFIIGAMSITSPQQIKDASPLIKSTSAAKKDKIFLIDSSKILRPSPRIVDEIENLYLELKK